MARKMILETLEEFIREFDRSNPDGASKARKCLPYIQCFTCLDTERIIGDRAVLTAFGYDPYMIRSCVCTGRMKDLHTTTHLNHTHNNRPVLYTGSYGTPPISSKGDLIRVLAEIYERDYEPREKEAEQLKAAAAKAEADRKQREKEEADRKQREKEEADRKKKQEEDDARRKRAEELKPYENKTEDELFRHASWKDVKNRGDRRDIRDTHITVDIEALIKEVSSMIEVYSGNLFALTDLVRNIDMKFRDFKSYENKEDVHIQVKEDKHGHPFFMKFTYRFIEDIVENHCCFMDFSKKVKKIDSHLIVMRPKDDNLEAVEICRRLMNKEAEIIIKGIL